MESAPKVSRSLADGIHLPETLVPGYDSDGAGFRLVPFGDGSWNVEGEIDAHNAAAFEAGLARATSDPGQVVLRMKALHFIDVAGMRAIARVAMERPGCVLVLEDATPLMRKCWTLLGYDRSAPTVTLSGQ